jgi:hypothetical protein
MSSYLLLLIAYKAAAIVPVLVFPVAETVWLPSLRPVTQANSGNGVGVVRPSVVGA